MMHREDHQQHPYRSGFTLLELLVVIGLLAVLSLTLMGSLRLGGRVWEHSASVPEPSDDLRLAAQFLTNSLINAYPLLDRSDSLHPMLRFSGEAKAVRYMAPMPQVLGSAGLAQIEVRLERGAAGTGTLLIELHRELAFADAAPWPPTLLLDRVQDIDIAYFGAMERGQAPDWRDHWQSAVALPQLVRIRVAFPPGDERVWPELIIAPRVSMEATCSYDALIQDCRGR